MRIAGDRLRKRARSPAGGGAGFTLVELLVAVGLMAILLTMIATVFQRATESFTMARTTVRIHQNARAAFDTMIRDLAGAAINFAVKDEPGYFAIGWMPDPEDDSGLPVQALTFTTYADQPGAHRLIPGVSPQLGLVRYTLRRDGGQITRPDGTTAPTFFLIKQVRFPQIAYYFVDMDEFDDSYIPDETVTEDVLALHVLAMRVRILYRGHYINVLDHGRATFGDAGSIEDTTKNWPVLPDDLPDDTYAMVVGGNGAPGEEESITGNTAVTITAAFSSVPSADSTYRIEQAVDSLTFPAPAPLPPETADNVLGQPQWLSLPPRDADVVAGTTYFAANMYPMKVIERVTPPVTVPARDVADIDIRMPYVVEVTLELTGENGARFHTFTQRFFIPDSVTQ